MCVWEHREGRGRKRISQRLTTEHEVWFRAGSHDPETKTPAETKGWMLNPASHQAPLNKVILKKQTNMAWTLKNRPSPQPKLFSSLSRGIIMDSTWPNQTQSEHLSSHNWTVSSVTIFMLVYLFYYSFLCMHTFLSYIVNLFIPSTHVEHMHILDPKHRKFRVDYKLLVFK